MARSLEACSYKEQTAADNKVVAVKKPLLLFFPPSNLKNVLWSLLFFSFTVRDKISVRFWSSAHLQHHSWAYLQASVNSANRAAAATSD